MLAVATSLGAAAKVLGKKKEEGRMETRCKANLTRGTNNSLNLFNNFYFNTCTLDSLFSVGCKSALSNCYNEMERGLANVRLRFKCLKVQNSHTQIYIERRLKVNFWQNEA